MPYNIHNYTLRKNFYVGKKEKKNSIITKEFFCHLIFVPITLVFAEKYVVHFYSLSIQKIGNWLFIVVLEGERLTSKKSGHTEYLEFQVVGIA